jgi:photosystem II stability/assembly factor-like uncharacterized protein
MAFLCLASDGVTAQTWTTISSGTKNNLTQIVFTDSLNGYVIADAQADSNSEAMVLKTSDGGLHWKPVLSRKAKTYRGIDFISKDTGVVIGQYSFDTCFKTFDGGNSWIRQQLQYDVGSFIHMASADDWYYVRSQHWGNTSNGGASWIDSTLGNSGMLPITTRDIQFLDSKTAYLFGDYPVRILRSGDGGKSWSKMVPNPPMLSIGSGRFTSLAKGVCADNGNGFCRLYTTLDSGSNWTVVDSLPGRAINCLRNQGANRFYAVGKNGYVTASADGGTNWLPENSGTTQHLNKVVILSNNVMAVGDSGTIIMRTLPTTAAPHISHNADDISVFPNPGSRVLTVRLEAKTVSGPVLFNVYNGQGQKLGSYLLNERSNEIDVSALPAGHFYYQVLENGTAVKSGKIERM